MARYPDATWIPAGPTNWSPGRTVDVRELVIHSTEGTNVEGLHAWLTNDDERLVVDGELLAPGPLSVHFMVDQDGNVFQYVDTDDTAYHARDHNRFSVGIEHVGWADDPATWTPAMVEASAKLAAWINEKHPLVELDADHVVAHGSFQADRTDPGPYFPWAEYLSRARAYRSGGFVASLFGTGPASVIVVVVAALAIAQLWSRNG